eukprot:8510335-Alexandrium_andersonii.AAC.1
MFNASWTKVAALLDGDRKDCYTPLFPPTPALTLTRTFTRTWNRTEVKLSLPNVRFRTVPVP